MSRVPAVIFLACLLVSAGPLSAASEDLIDSQLLGILADELSGELARDHVIAITRHHRVQGSRGYSDAARYVLTQLRDFGFSESEAWTESFPSDGKIVYQTWQSPPGWWVERAELRMVLPYQERLVRYPEIPMSVITYSNPGRVRTELVDVGAGTSAADYQGKDVKGKLVLATGYGGAVHRLAVLEYGAAAVVCFLDDDRASSHPDMIGYTGMWPRTEELERVTFGFNLSNRQGKKLKALLASGKRVVLDAVVEGPGLGDGRMDVVTARIPGQDESRELILIAHLDHPKESANDNASGSAALLDMARTFRKLVSDRRLPRPRYTIKFLWVPEYYGTMAYVDNHPELRGVRLGGGVLAGLNLDMVGENLEMLHSRLNITWTPATISSVLTDVVAAAAEQVDALESRYPVGSPRSNFNYRVVPFSGGSDHVVLNDGAIAIPSMMLNHWPDYTHHTTEDTPDKVDPVQLERCELVASASFWYLAGLKEDQARQLATRVASRGQARLVADTSKAAGWILQSQDADLEKTYQDAKHVVDLALRRETEALASLLDFAPFVSAADLVETWRQALEGQAELQRRSLHALFNQRVGRFPRPRRFSPAELEARTWIPGRTTRGPLSGGLPAERLPESDRPWYESAEARQLDTYLLVNLIDGRRSILQIRDDLTAATEPVSLANVDRFIRGLEQVGLIKLTRQP